MFHYQNRRQHSDKQIQAWYGEIAKLEAQINDIEAKIQDRLNLLAAEAEAKDPLYQDFIKKMTSWDDGTHPWLVAQENAKIEAAEQRQRQAEKVEQEQRELAAKAEYIEKLNRRLPY